LLVSLVRIVVYIVLLSLIAGCGFHLRGSQGDDVVLERIHISSTNARDEFVRELKDSLQRRNMTVVDERADASYSLRVSPERTSRRAVATSSDVTVSEYELRMAVEFELFDTGGEPVIESTEIIAERIFVFDRNSLTGTGEEEELLKEEMRRDLVRQMIRRVNAAVNSAPSRSVGMQQESHEGLS